MAVMMMMVVVGVIRVHMRVLMVVLVY